MLVIASELKVVNDLTNRLGELESYKSVSEKVAQNLSKENQHAVFGEVLRIDLLYFLTEFNQNH